MRTVRTAFLASAAALAVAGATGLALAATPVFHTMTIRLPGGGVEHIRYTGKVAPSVAFVSGPAVANIGYWDAAWPFADFDRISAMMDRQFAQMMDQARALDQMAASGGLNEAVLKDAPPGTSSYSMVTTVGGNGVCSRSVQITSSPGGGKPKVVSQSSGNCGSQSGGSMQGVSAGATQANGLQSISFKAGRAAPDRRHGI